MNDDIKDLFKLPYFLFRKILSYLDHNIDKIVFSLVSKKLYDNRNRYLNIPLNITNQTSRSMIKNLKLRSFVNQIESYDHLDDSYHTIKTIITVGHDHFGEFPKVFSSYFNNESLQQLNETDISDDIEELFFTREIDSLLSIPALKRIKSINVPLISPIDYAIPNNIRSLRLVFDSISGESFGKNASLPSQLESLTLYSCHTQFEKGFFPLSLKNLRLVDAAPKFDYGVLPEYLESLEIQYSSYDQPIAKRVLPTSLRSIGLASYTGKLVFYNPYDDDDVDDDRDNSEQQQLLNTYIPNTVKMIMIGTPPSIDNKPLVLKLPYGLKKLRLDKSFNQKLSRFVVPDTLTRLKLISSDQFDRIPGTINYLYLSLLKRIGRFANDNLLFT
ncbi:hypothetical protein PPL_00381 [Heterostelium album PN500]|uniref:F-box domain-containing protein n=1 Tax=Heterostelium pallidum (strain ATCC 26659 / Pp 5 / PN500) TaxID=670386 RepID=D3AWA7_HETP5|nr:hypothetical protein PPL_00381 [Heterostelium album PN500]EFA86580.1 hypothetical protein PPL_00381 [Heterostelium album PN500]|eukprot:XP_020438685.1 hypothetical protein PPL_00381 [Heterostelium album PN500]